MKELELSYYFKEINEFRFKDVFKNCKYPWEALANINKYIREFMDDKNMQINKAEVGEFCSIEGPYFIDEGTEIHANTGTSIDRKKCRDSIRGSNKTRFNNRR